LLVHDATRAGKRPPLRHPVVTVRRDGLR